MSTIFPASQCVDFAGYRHWPEYKLPRKRNVHKAARRFAGLTRCYAAGKVDTATVRCCVASFIGYMQPCDPEGSPSGLCPLPTCRLTGIDSNAQGLAFHRERPGQTGAGRQSKE